MSARVFSRNSAFICARARYDNSEKLGYSSESESTTAQESELTVSWFSVRAHFTLAATIQLDSTLAAGLGTRIYDVPRLAQYNAACRQALAACSPRFYYAVFKHRNTGCCLVLI